MTNTVKVGLMPNATNFREFNMVGAIEIANDILEYIQKLQLPAEVAMDLCKTMQSDEDIQCDPWMRISWGLVDIELMERRIRVEDPQTESNGPNFNGGFNLPAETRRAYEDNLVGPLRGGRTATGEPMPADPAYSVEPRGLFRPQGGSPNGQ